MTNGKKPYFPNNWKQWKEVPDEFLYAPTFGEFIDWKLASWELPSSICCIIRETTSKGKIKEYVYQKRHAANNKIEKLMKTGNEFVVCSDSIVQFIPAQNTNLLTDEPDYD